MLRDALRRVLWLVPTVALITLSAFWLVSSSHVASTPGGASAPRFFNQNPQGARERSLSAAERIARGGPLADSAALELAQIGGAALPHVLTHLDALSPDERVRVALALSPIAERMGLARSDEFKNRETVVLFWTRFWQDHAIDFRPAVVKRAVRRAVERPSPLRRKEVLAFDTFALPEIMSGLNEASRSRNSQDFAILTGLAAAITGQAWIATADASEETRSAVARKWHRFWSEHRQRYVAFQGTDRLLAMIRETQYGLWVSQLTRGGFGEASAAESVVAALRSQGKVTAALVGSGLLGGYIAGLALAVAAALRERFWSVGAATAALVAALVPVTVFCRVLSAGNLQAAAIIALGVGSAVYFHQRGPLAEALLRPCFVTDRAFGLSPLRSAIRALRLSAASGVSLAGIQAPLVVTAAFVVEHAHGLRGLGPATVSAVQTGNLPWLMGVALVVALAAGLLQIASDVVLQAVRPRTEGALDLRGVSL